jgi:hypothetical protein
VYEVLGFDPDYPVYRYDDVVGYRHDVPELEALMRHAMVLHNEFPWNREDTRLTAVGALGPDDVVLLLYPRSVEVSQFVRRVQSCTRHDSTAAGTGDAVSAGNAGAADRGPPPVSCDAAPGGARRVPR